jgi:hypothetical protein
LTRALPLACFTSGEGSPTSATHWARAKSRMRVASSKVQFPPVARNNSCTASRTCDCGSKKSLSPLAEVQLADVEHPSGAVHPFRHPLITNPVIDKRCALVINTRAVSGGEVPPTSGAAACSASSSDSAAGTPVLDAVALSRRISLTELCSSLSRRAGELSFMTAADFGLARALSTAGSTPAVGKVAPPACAPPSPWTLVWFSLGCRASASAPATLLEPRTRLC